MSPKVQIDVTDIMPKAEAVFMHQGISQNVQVNDRIHKLLAAALDLFTANAKPQGLITEISKREFAAIYDGEGYNEEDTPLAQIYPQADGMALFALTMGSKVSTKITELFEVNDFALGFMLDAVASLAADNAVEVCETHFHNNRATASPSAENYVLSYSPGYCGWHISGQRKLFEFLHPEEIGIALNESFLMTPLKSVTGVLVAGDKRIHIFKSNYPFCDYCKSHSCRPRIKAIVDSLQS